MVITTKKEATEIVEAIIGIVKKEFPNDAPNILSQILQVKVIIE